MLNLTSVFHATVLFMNEFEFDNVDDEIQVIVNNRTDALKTDINLVFTKAICRIGRSRSLTRRIKYKFMCLSAY